MPLNVASRVTICNLALGEVPDRPIQSFTEESVQARECRRFYDQALAELLEAHPWSWAMGRTVLAQLASDRPQEWPYAYAPPQNLAFLRSIRPGVATDPYYTPMVGQTLVIPSPIGGALSADFGDRAVAYAIELGEGVIYSDAPPGSMAEFTRSDVSEGSFTPSFVRALSLSIAWRICTPLSKADKKPVLFQEAELAKQRAMAMDLNRTPHSYDNVPDAWAVRM